MESNNIQEMPAAKESAQNQSPGSPPSSPGELIKQYDNTHNFNMQLNCRLNNLKIIDLKKNHYH